MTNHQKVLNLLGLAMRARKVILGEEFVLKAMRNPKAMVFLATDSGSNISKKVLDKSEFYGTKVIHTFTSTELSKAIGKDNRKVILLEDKGFVNKITDYLST